MFLLLVGMIFNSFAQCPDLPIGGCPSVPLDGNATAPDGKRWWTLDTYAGSGSYWRITDVKVVNAQGKHNVFVYLPQYHPINTTQLNAIDFENTGDLHLILGDNIMEWKVEGSLTHVEYDLYTHDNIKVQVYNQPCDTVSGFRTNIADIANCGTYGHFLYKVCYQWTTSTSPTKTPTPPPSPTATVKPGDCNCDGSITPGDALLAFQFYLEIAQPATTPCDQARAADIDNSSSITPGDALCIFKMYMEQPC